MTTPFCSTESPTALGRISQVLKGGGIVATTKDETHYLIGSALSQEAIEKMYQIKKKEPQNALVVFASNLQMVERLAPSISHEAHKLAESLWPSSLVLVLPVTGVPTIVTAGTNATGICCPTQKFLRQIISISGPIVIMPVPSEAVSNISNADILTDYDLQLSKNSPVVDAREVPLRRLDSEDFESIMVATFSE